MGVWGPAHQRPCCLVNGVVDRLLWPHFLLVQEDEGVWVPEAEDAESPEQQQEVPLDRVLRIVESAYGQRQDKEHNPHGEHAHDVWQVCERGPLPVCVWGGRGGGGAAGDIGSSSSLE